MLVGSSNVRPALALLFLFFPSLNVAVFFSYQFRTQYVKRELYLFHLYIFATQGITIQTKSWCTTGQELYLVDARTIMICGGKQQKQRRRRRKKSQEATCEWVVWMPKESDVSMYIYRWRLLYQYDSDASRRESRKTKCCGRSHTCTHAKSPNMTMCRVYLIVLPRVFVRLTVPTAKHT